ncbi:MAG: ABC transporter permease [Chloroflexi bacterium]|nr:ABC transporter permease [Chloroflexota bacterium]
MMRGFWVLTVSQVKMLSRNVGYMTGSLGLAVISMLVFGSLFGSDSTKPFSLGLVDEDRSLVSAQVVQGLEQSGIAKITLGSRAKELKALRDGDRRVVLVMEPGFGQALSQGQQSSLVVYYDTTNIVGSSIASNAVKAVVDVINRQITGVPEPIVLREEGVRGKTLRQIDFMTPGMVGMMLMFANLTVGIGLVGWRERGILKRLGVTPLRPFNLIASQVAAHLIFAFAQAAILLLIAAAGFSVHIEGDKLLLALTVGVGAFAMLSIGYLLGGLIRSTEAVYGVTMTLSFPMMFLGGSYFPVDDAPGVLHFISKAIPLTYLNDALRAIINEGAGLGGIRLELFVLTGWMVVTMALATRLFRWQ